MSRSLNSPKHADMSHADVDDLFNISGQLDIDVDSPDDETRTQNDEAKEDLLELLGEDPEKIMSALKLKRIQEDSAAYILPDFNNPLRLFWYEEKRHIVVKSCQPTNSIDVGNVLMHMDSAIEELKPELLGRIRFHINSGSHGDACGEHAHKGEKQDLAVNSFFLEDLETALDLKAQVSISNMADIKQHRKCPESAFMVMDAFCWSGRKHHYHGTEDDPRFGSDNVELIVWNNLVPFMNARNWDYDDEAEQEVLALVDGKYIHDMSYEDARDVLTDKKSDNDECLAAFVRVGGDETGLRVLCGRLESEVLSAGQIVFFTDNFKYHWGDAEVEQECITVTKEPKSFSGSM